MVSDIDMREVELRMSRFKAMNGMENAGEIIINDDGTIERSDDWLRRDVIDMMREDNEMSLITEEGNKVARISRIIIHSMIIMIMGVISYYYFMSILDIKTYGLSMLGLFVCMSLINIGFRDHHNFWKVK